MTNAEFIEGVAILAKHLPEDQKSSYDLCAEHDQIWFCDYNLVPKGEDEDRLLKLGWFEDEDAWSCIV